MDHQSQVLEDLVHIHNVCLRGLKQGKTEMKVHCSESSLIRNRYYKECGGALPRAAGCWSLCP